MQQQLRERLTPEARRQEDPIGMPVVRLVALTFVAAGLALVAGWGSERGQAELGASGGEGGQSLSGRDLARVPEGTAHSHGQVATRTVLQRFIGRTGWAHGDQVFKRDAARWGKRLRNGGFKRAGRADFEPANDRFTVIVQAIVLRDALGAREGVAVFRESLGRRRGERVWCLLTLPGGKTRGLLLGHGLRKRRPAGLRDGVRVPRRECGVIGIAVVIRPNHPSRHSGSGAGDRKTSANARLELLVRPRTPALHVASPHSVQPARFELALLRFAGSFRGPQRKVTPAQDGCVSLAP